jgi:CRP/FNR family transcriptional regulator, cyclic AMP receptor protein
VEPGLAASLLGKCELFSSLDQGGLESLARASTEVHLRRGERLYEAGDPADLAYVVANGSVRLVLGSGAKEMTLGVVGQGDSFGEIALLDGGARGAAAEATEDSVVLGIPRAAGLGLVATHQGFAEALLAALGRVVRGHAGDMVECLFLDLEGRVARLLLMLAGARDEPRDGDRLDLGRSQSEIASMVHGSRQRVNHVLSSLEALGCIRREGPVLVLTDVALLRRRSEV